ncbi:hypothetical protein E2562_037513 [Oryza meyeriana var. granulata]|uniref:Uncharacterized protein n=1 Tax=Oryza meyeriana var. granulata TaxID=110450 RepID=A0A6G1CBH7_9ORYZ|nr:hypothetical protein E2562_037513 [Oryza meyeriana var. granulata]
MVPSSCDVRLAREGVMEDNKFGYAVCLEDVRNFMATSLDNQCEVGKGGRDGSSEVVLVQVYELER